MQKKVLIGLAILFLLGGIGLVGTVGYGFRLMRLPTGGMANTILPSENIAVTKFYGEIKRGDILVFKYPKNPSIYYIKRVVGLPNETIEVRGKQILINGHELQEKKIKVDLAVSDSQSEKPMREIAEEGAGEYRVYYDKTTWDGASYDHEMKYAVREPFKIPPGQYFMMGDSRDNSMDSRYWGTVTQDAILYKAYLIYNSPNPQRIFTKLK